ncbi:MAG: AraC family transcriptional regulator [Bacteroidetes bacterium HGW-Bacteroidetes-21]|nr:MAG: AraC family transcriptional regulator [Bacteroidetes bacterium HGW-Bacteroidetes-21]
MVCIRCEMVVKSVFENLSIKYLYVKIGEADISENITDSQKYQLSLSLKKTGLELLDDKKGMLVERIKNAIIELVYVTEDKIRENLSDFLSHRLEYDYTYLSNLFSEVKGTTVEQFFIQYRIERAKELLVYNELSLTEISYKLHFSSVAHLSRQFKKVTGLTPSHFKYLKNLRNETLENL